MRILFVENRYKTGLWEIIAGDLIRSGHEICWIVQNHVFRPSVGETIVIPYFKGEYVGEKVYDDSINKVISSNRGLRHFRIQSDDFIFYYRDKIKEAIEILKPDVAFGEATQFHELLICNACKEKRILFLHPITCRYPAGRFSFYLYDTLEPFAGSGEQLDNEQAVEIINHIVKRKVVPDYMKVIKPRINLKDKIIDKVRLTYAYFTGDKFNVPAPWIKQKVEIEKKRRIKEWDSLADYKVRIEDKFKILYPLQMQPESNIDVWGYPYNDQLLIIKKILLQLRDNDVLYVKPNPKSKYELTSGLIDLLKENSSKVRLLAHSVSMKEVFPNIDFVITVTGTISFECIWAGKPFIMLGQGIQKNYAVSNCIDNRFFTLEHIEMKEEEKIKLINWLVATSYRGKIGDTLYSREYIDDSSNIDNIIVAFKHSINTIQNGYRK